MDKRCARIIFGCLAGTVIVILLFLLASRLTQPSCELIIIEQTQFRSQAHANFLKSEDKPIRSHDKSTLFKISAYLEYNIKSKDKSHNAPNSGDPNAHGALKAEQNVGPNQQQLAQPYPPQANPAPPNSAGPLQQQQQQQQQPLVQVPAQASSQQTTGAIGVGVAGGKSPTPSSPQSGFTSQQIANSSMPLNNLTNGNASSKSEKPRFLPIELEDIEMKKKEDNKYSYTLNFNCSTMKLLFVRTPSKVFVEKITMELEPKSRKESSCEVHLPTPEVFATEVSPADNWAHYYCDKPLNYSCYHYKNQEKVLLAELHIIGIEFETTGIVDKSKDKPIHKEHKFLSSRKYCL